MANFTKTSKTESVIIAVLVIILIGGLVLLFIRDNQSPSGDLPVGENLIEPQTVDKE